MMTLSAKWIAEELLELLSEHEYEVHSTFDSGFNLRVADILCYIGNKYDMKLPYAVILNSGEYAKLQCSEAQLRGQTFRWNPSARQFESKDCIIQTAQAKTYNSCLKTVITDQASRQEACEILKQVIDADYAIGENLPVAELLRIMDGNRNSSDSEEWNDEMLLSPQELSDEMTSSPQKQEEYAQRILRGVVGFGPGLTPAGDDFIEGIIYIYYLFGIRLSDTFTEVLTDMLATGYTTDTSVHYYHCAMRGMFSQPLLELAEALSQKPEATKSNMCDTQNIENNARHTIEHVKRCIHTLYTFGHTSGHDTAAGILAAVKGMEHI